MGARMHYAVPIVLMRQGLLARFYTDLFLPQEGFGKTIKTLLEKFTIRELQQVLGRSSNDLPANRVRANNLLGFQYALSRKLNSNQDQLDQVYSKYSSRFAAWVANDILEDIKTVYAINSTALELFHKAKSLNICCILEQIIAPFTVLDRLLQEEYAIWIGWEETPPARYGTALSERESREWALSDKIFAASQFVVDELVGCGVPRERCIIVPYTVDVNRFTPKSIDAKINRSRKLKVLFVGSVSLRKGIQYLSEALNILDSDSFEVKIAGRSFLNIEANRRLQEHCQLLGLVPRSQIIELFQWADLLVLPSICEGSALVTYEALSSGLPVVTTPNAGSVVVDGMDGFIIPIRDSEALARVLEKALDEPEMLASMSLAARRHAERELSLEAYQERLVRAIIESHSL